MPFRALAHVVVLLVLPAFALGCGGTDLPIEWLLPNKAGDNRPENPTEPDDPGDGGQDGGGNGGGSGSGGGNGGGGSGGGGNGGQTDTRFSGTWISAYGDDLPDGVSQRQHVVQLTLTQNNASISGSGQMVRFYNTGQTAYDANPILLTVNGTVSGTSARINLTGTQTDPFTYDPQWYVRYAGNQLVGAYAEKDPGTGSLANGGRMGHGIWHRATTLSPTGEWVAAFADDSGGGNFPQRVRTAQLSLTDNDDNTVTGLGSFVEFGPAGGPNGFTFDITQGESQLRRLEFTIGNFQPANGTEDWYVLQTNDVMVGAYSRFDDNDTLTRFGHAEWQRSPAANSNEYVREWVTAFGDDEPAGDDGSDFFMAFTAFSVNGNTVNGMANVWDESENNPTFRTYTVENGTITGSNLALDLVFGSRRFVWDMRLANGRLLGTYRRTGANNTFQGAGRAEWQFGSRSNLAGTWVASFFDTYSANLAMNQIEDRASQVATLIVSNVDQDGVVTGTGHVRLANESSRRNFTINGQVTGAGVEMTWSGSDLFGDTVWQMQKAGGRLAGTYSNLDDQNFVEHQGHATFIRAE